MKKYSPEWTPGFGAIYFWVAMDKNKRIAVMINNNWGWIPKAVLTLPNIDSLMNELICYIWGESKIEKFISHPRYLNNYNGGFNLDMLSYWYHKKIDRIKIINNLKKELAEGKNNSDAYIAVNRGFFFMKLLMVTMKVMIIQLVLKEFIKRKQKKVTIFFFYNLLFMEILKTFQKNYEK